MTDRTTCASVDDALAEAALDLLDPADRLALQDHLAVCDRCSAELESLSSVADRLATLAPEAEPPLGFEQRAVAAMTGPGRSRLRWAPAVAAAVLLLVGALTLVLVGNHQDARATVATGRLLSANHAYRGDVVVGPARDGGSGVSLTMSLEGVPAGTYHCNVVGDDGQRIEIAAWTVSDAGSHLWTVPLRGVAARTPSVSVTDDSGREIATAELR
ncbi:MAG: hypothetical protein U0Q22_04785 [Acidimicrobiales bacterium]